MGRDSDIERLEKKLAEAQAELELLTYAVSHDLRAPMRAIQGFSLILHDDYASRLDDEGKRYLDIVIQSSKQLHSYLDDLLSYSRVGRKELNKQLVDVRASVNSAIRVVTAERQADPVKILDLPNCLADSELLKEVWIQLLSNAFKFADPARPLQIEVGGKKEGHEIIYWVKDNGLGFEEKYLSRLFVVFQKLHGHLKLPGNGIGLAMSKRIIGKHEGRIWAESKNGEGTTVSFALPEK